MSRTKINTKLNYPAGNGQYFQGLPETSIEQVTGLAEKIELFQYPFLQRNKTYQVGDIAYSPNLPSYLRLECVTAGTTASTEPDFTENSAGGVLTLDGGVLWIIDDIRDGTLVGDITYSPILRAGHVKANGALLLSASTNYPRLVSFVARNSLSVIDDTAWESNKAAYVYNETNNTLRVPDMDGRVLQGGDVQGSKEAGLPNVTGAIVSGPATGLSRTSSGAFYGNTESVRKATGEIYQGAGYMWFDASLSNAIYSASTTVQPPALVQIAQIRY